MGRAHEFRSAMALATPTDSSPVMAEVVASGSSDRMVPGKVNVSSCATALEAATAANRAMVLAGERDHRVAMVLAEPKQRQAQ